MNVAKILDTMEYGPAPESRAEADAWLQAADHKFGLFVHGKWVAPASKRTFKTHNPATGELLATLSQAGAKDVNAAVKAAQLAHKKWAALSGHDRARHLYALARLVQKHARILSVIETLDNGKPIRESRDIDIPLVARHFYHHAGWAQLSDQEFPDHSPLGVVGQIIPWNFPLLMLAWKIAPALAAGNTVVLKPAEFTSLSALMFAELCQEAGIPEGVVNIITGDGATGKLLVAHPDVHKIAFTGSTEVGRIIRKSTAGSGKALSLELGGKSPFIVFDDCDMDSAIEGVVDAIWFNQGQVCCAGSRLLVQESITKRFITKLKARMAALRVGDPLDKCMDMGAIVDESQRKNIDALVKQSAKEGATVWQSKASCPKKGCYYPPTLLTDVESSNLAAQEEIFGPVLAAMTFRTQDEAIALANNTRYGLAASIWSENINRALDVAPALKAGVVWVNCTNQFDAAVGFGGYRESGFGREGGHEGMYEYLKPTYLSKLKPLKKFPKRKISTAKGTGAKASPFVDQTAKFYIGGKQARPDGGNSLSVISSNGVKLGLVGDGSRKDIRNAVEAARKAEGWSKTTPHNRAQILYYIAENLSARSEEFANRISAMTGASAKNATREVDASIARLFSYGAWADKYEGRIHTPPMRGVALAMNEPVGIVGVVCPDARPLLGFISLMAPNIAMGNRVIMIPSQTDPLSATDFYQVLETSDVPGGVVNIVTGSYKAVVHTLAEHDQVDAMWCFGPADLCTKIETAGTPTITRSWTGNGMARDWYDRAQGEGREFLRHATEVKNIWIPYGD